MNPFLDPAKQKFLIPLFAIFLGAMLRWYERRWRDSLFVAIFSFCLSSHCAALVTFAVYEYFQIERSGVLGIVGFMAGRSILGIATAVGKWLENNAVCVLTKAFARVTGITLKTDPTCDEAQDEESRK